MVETPVLINDEILGSIEEVVSRRQKLNCERAQVEEDAIRQLALLEKEIVELKKLLKIGMYRNSLSSVLRTILIVHADASNKEAASFSCPEVAAAMAILRTSVRQLEPQMKECIATWEKAVVELKKQPLLETQKNLWVDFCNNPQVVKANVDAAKKQAASMAAQK